MAQVVQNTNATPASLFATVGEMFSVTGDTSALEYEIDTLASLVLDLIQDLSVLQVPLSSGTSNRIANINEFLTYSSINFVELDAGSPYETWKIPYAVGLKKQVRDIQAWYLTTKTRLFGSI